MNRQAIAVMRKSVNKNAKCLRKLLLKLNAEYKGNTPLYENVYLALYQSRELHSTLTRVLATYPSTQVSEG